MSDSSTAGSGPAVPVIDLSGWDDGDAASRAAIAASVDRAAREVGFFQIAGHGVDPATLDAALSAMDALFALPLDRRLALLPEGPHINRGYAPAQSEGLAYSLGEDTPPDLLEAFVVGPDHPDLDDPAVVATRDSVFAPNHWPDDLPDAVVRDPIVAYFDAVSALAHRLADIFAVALGVPADFFADKVDHSTETMRLNHYTRRAGDPDPLPGQSWLGAHTDYGIVTVLHGDRVPGLEVLVQDGRWEPLVPEPGAFVVNIGDLLAEWTNDRWRSTLHRVLPPAAPAVGQPEARRRSLAFFLDGNHDAVVECLPTCTSADDPPRYPPVVAGDHLRAKVLAGRTLSTEPRDGINDTIGDRLDRAR